MRQKRNRRRRKEDDRQKKERIRRLVLSGMLAGTFISLPLCQSEASAAVRTAEPVSDTPAAAAAAARAQADAALAMRKKPVESLKPAKAELAPEMSQDKQKTQKMKPETDKTETDKPASAAEQKVQKKAETKEKLQSLQTEGQIEPASAESLIGREPAAFDTEAEVLRYEDAVYSSTTVTAAPALSWAASHSLVDTENKVSILPEMTQDSPLYLSVINMQDKENQYSIEDALPVDEQLYQILPDIFSTMGQNISVKDIEERYEARRLNTENPAQYLAGVREASELTGATANSVRFMQRALDTVEEHFSLLQDGKPAKEQENTVLWVKYLHPAYAVDGMRLGDTGAAYDTKMNLLTVGCDLVMNESQRTGAAFSFARGGSQSALENDRLEAWSASYYDGVYSDKESQVFDLSYAEVKHELQGLVAAKPKTTIFSIGVRDESSRAVGDWKLVTSSGLRYMNVSMAGYDGSVDGLGSTHYRPGHRPLWLMPFGIGLVKEQNEANGAWSRLAAGVSYVRSLGGTMDSMTVGIPGVMGLEKVNYDVAARNSWLAYLGFEKKKADLSYGVNYSYQRGAGLKENRYMMNLVWHF